MTAQITKQAAKPVGDKYITRIQLDRDMGDVFHWVTGLRPSVRAREMLALMRLGFAVHQGHAALIPLQPTHAGAADAATPSLGIEGGATEPSVQPESDPISEAMTRDQQAMQAMGFDLNFFTPPSPQPASAH